MSDFEVVVGGVFQHVDKGTYYRVVVISNQYATPDRSEEFPLMVTYQELDSNKFWSRPMNKFKERVKPNNNYGQGGIL